MIEKSFTLEMRMNGNTCCFIGHRTITETNELRAKLYKSIERLITDENVDTFLFGSKSRFDRLCLEIVTKIKEKHPHIKRIYVRAEFPDVTNEYISYLLKLYDDTYYPEKLAAAGKAAYVERNREMIDKSKYCIVYYDEQNAPTKRKSGTKVALDYALKMSRDILIYPVKPSDDRN